MSGRNHNNALLVLLSAVLLAGCGHAPLPNQTPAERAENHVPRGFQHLDTFVSCTAAPADIQLFWKESNGRLLGSLGAVKTFVESSRRTLSFAMNAGMYMEDRYPLGLFIQESKTLHRINRDTGYGNFYLRPNGVFFITRKGNAGVCRTDDFPGQKAVRCATQSGPMLLTGGRFHPAFKKGSANLNIRNGVGILPDGKVLFAISTVPVNLYDFAQFFKKQGCANALYLDGYVSRAYYPKGGLDDTGGAFGVMIGVVKAVNRVQ